MLRIMLYVIAAYNNSAVRIKNPETGGFHKLKTFTFDIKITLRILVKNYYTYSDDAFGTH